MMFDRRIYVDRLKQAGVEEGVARAHAEALREAILGTVATKADLDAAIASVMGAVAEGRTAATTGLAALRAGMTALEHRLDHKIELLGRDLIIKGAGALVILATLMIGLKLSG